MIFMPNDVLWGGKILACYGLFPYFQQGEASYFILF